MTMTATATPAAPGLSPELQDVQECRDECKRAEIKLHQAKELVKERSAYWKQTVERLNEALDIALDRQRQPTLFAAVPAAEPGWRKLTPAEAFADTPDVAGETLAALAAAGVTTCGELADRLKAGETFGQPLIVIQGVCEAVELMSADDPEPVTFNEDEAKGEAEAEAEDGADCEFPADPFSDRTAQWEARLALRRKMNQLDAADKHMAGQIEDYRWRQKHVSEDSEPEWGSWSEFKLQTTAFTGGDITVLYKPDWHGMENVDHVEFWGPGLSDTGYWSDELRWDQKKGRPAGSLEDWARKYLKKRASKYAKTKAPAAKPAGKKGGKA